MSLAGRGRRLAAATAGLRKASELFAHSCPIYSHDNQPLLHAAVDNEFDNVNEKALKFDDMT